ncbi:hypothetical protein HPTD01_515 [Halomonas sp. TD01]|nr:hypothetical protein HPTD01_515 [Halomonas sp. TD01]
MQAAPIGQRWTCWVRKVIHARVVWLTGAVGAAQCGPKGG